MAALALRLGPAARPVSPTCPAISIAWSTMAPLCSSSAKTVPL
jgi:hypothetical protein